MAKRALHTLLFSIIVLSSAAQTGGDNVYEFLNLTLSAHVASLGGTNVSLQSQDLNMAYCNPALLSAEMGKSLALDYVNYFAGINYGMALYSESFGEKGNFAAGLTYLNYGTFTESDISGGITGNFRASEYAFSMIYSRSIDSMFTVGVNLKPVLSYLERYSSYGFALDIGIAWHSRSNMFSAALALKNIGSQITTYAGEPHERLPFEIQAGITRRLAFAPFRFSLTLRHLEKYDLTHDYTTAANSLTGGNGKPEFLENMMRHAILGAELIPHKNFYVCGGYNYQRRKELQVDSKISTVGFSWGFGINTSLLNVELGRATYHLAGSSTTLTIVLKTNNIFRKLHN